MPNKNQKRSGKPKQKLRPLDRGANYNAFGRDPDGRRTFMSAFFFGPDYVPEYTPQQFAGPPEPPRFGPPAPYQIACLPQGWKPRPPPNFYGAGAIGPPYLDPPSGRFDPDIFAALKHVPRFRPDPNSDTDSVDGYSTEATSETEQWSDRVMEQGSDEEAEQGDQGSDVEMAMNVDGTDGSREVTVEMAMDVDGTDGSREVKVEMHELVEGIETLVIS